MSQPAQENKMGVMPENKLLLKIEIDVAVVEMIERI